MSAEPLAEVYEKLKELRRQGNLPESVNESDLTQSGLEGVVRSLHEDNVKLKQVLEELAALADARAGSLMRHLEVRTLSNRIFGDEKKAEAWLNRTNPSLSGQRPVDLLKDELGAAVVREALERIDHGIFA